MKGQCTIDGCQRMGTPKNGKFYLRRGLCASHYHQWRRTEPSITRCKIPDCNAPVSGRGFCYRHIAQDRYYRKYGVSVEQAAKMAEKQGHLCAICHQPENGEKSLCMDHDHGTRKFRGLICSRCNRVLGLIADDVEIAQEMIRYLEKRRDPGPQIPDASEFIPTSSLIDGALALMN